MTAAAIGFYASAGIAVLAALAAVVARRPEQTLAGYVVAFAALLLPLIELGATTVAAVLLLAVVVIVTLLGILARARVEPAGGSRSITYWILAGLGVLGFAWVLLATGSRQVVDLGDPLPRNSTFGDGDALLRELGGTFVAPSLVIGLLALAAVIAAVLGQLPAHEREEP